MRHEIRLFLIAVQFLTRIPVPAWVGYDDAWLNDCVRHFPLVGLCVGLVGALALGVALMVFPPAVAVALSMIATVCLTGAFHEDGLADTCDGLGGMVSRERSLEIMKDSRIGTYGAIALALALGLKAATLTALVQIHPVLGCVALVWGHAASRAAPVWVIWRLAYAGDAEHAKAKPLAISVSGMGVAVAGAWVALMSAALWAVAQELGEADSVGWCLGVALLVVVLVVWQATRWLRHRLGGYTGDTLGAVQQVVEMAALLVWLAVATMFWGTYDGAA